MEIDSVRTQNQLNSPRSLAIMHLSMFIRILCIRGPVFNHENINHEWSDLTTVQAAVCNHDTNNEYLTTENYPLYG